LTTLESTASENCHLLTFKTLLNLKPKKTTKNNKKQPKVTNLQNTEHKPESQNIQRFFKPEKPTSKQTMKQKEHHKKKPPACS
jgi:hypothetical protein